MLVISTPVDLNKSIHVVSFDDDLLNRLAKDIIGACTSPDLSRCVICLPNLNASRRLRDLLLKHAQPHDHPALLGPRITTIRAWIDEHYPIDLRIASNTEREIILVNELRKHQKLIGRSSAWAMAESLLVLFDELTLHSIHLPTSLEEFIQLLHNAYGLQYDTLTSLDMEARLVYSLWHAWHDQLRQEALLDPQTAYLLKLAKAVENTGDFSFYIAGYNRLLPAELTWLSSLQSNTTCSVYIHADNYALQCQDENLMNFSPGLYAYAGLGQIPDRACNGHSPMAGYMKEIFRPEPLSMLDTKASVLAQYPQSPVHDNISIYAAASGEAEAEAVDIQVRQWLLQGKTNIGIITQDRKLARRIRALLERANVTIHDAAGWALSTTSAASVIEHWLQCIEEDFDYRPLLDCLKSPFVLPLWDEQERMRAVFRMEQDVIRHENIPRNLSRYRTHIHYRQSRADKMFPDASLALKLLDDVETAATPLSKLCRQTSMPAHAYLHAFMQSLSGIGIQACLANDAAGMRILEMLERLQTALSDRSEPVSWQEFRNLLSRTLEDNDYSPPAVQTNVTLKSLEQSSLHRYDALIIAGCDSGHMPGNIDTTPFFNDRVRIQLGIPLRRNDYNDLFYHFRQALLSCENILLTWRTHENGEPALPAPWLEIFHSSHMFYYGSDLLRQDLDALVRSPDAHVRAHQAPCPAVMSDMPRPVADPALLPASISVSSHQRLIDCPYQFFVSDCLQLAAAEDVRETMEKAEYGELVHLCLHAFHTDVPSLPGPFTNALCEDNRTEAIELLTEISDRVFHRNIEDNFQHRAWLKRWYIHIPEYISWQINRQKKWRIDETEVKAEKPVAEKLSLRGRLDRIDRSDDGMSILDYKTGKIPAASEVLSGESIQLASYTLLSESPVNEAGYVLLEETPVKDTVYLQGKDLNELASAVRERLSQVSESLHTEHTMPAWGDNATCAMCRFHGVCRKESWEPGAENLRE